MRAIQRYSESLDKAENVQIVIGNELKLSYVSISINSNQYPTEFMPLPLQKISIFNFYQKNPSLMTVTFTSWRHILTVFRSSSHCSRWAIVLRIIAEPRTEGNLSILTFTSCLTHPHLPLLPKNLIALSLKCRVTF